jgi:hypothetical protein
MLRGWGWRKAGAAAEVLFRSAWTDFRWLSVDPSTDKECPAAYTMM